MRIKESNTQFIFLHTYNIWSKEDSRHLANIAVGIKFIQKQFQNALIIIFLHDERKSDLKIIFSKFNININHIKFLNVKQFYNQLSNIYSENLFLFVSGHGNKDLGICSNIENFTPENFYSNINKIKHIRNIFIFYGQCYSGLYKNFIKTNNNLNLYILGCSNEYVGWSSESILQKSDESHITFINKQLESLENMFENINKLSLFLFEVFINLKSLLNKQLNENTLKEFYHAILMHYADDHLENSLLDDNKYLNLKNQMEELQKEIDVFYTKPNPDNEEYIKLDERLNQTKSEIQMIEQLNKYHVKNNPYKWFKDDIKKNGPFRLTKLHNGPEVIVNADKLFTKLFRGIPMAWCSKNFIWFEKK